ncbi:CBL-interacting serine/threonine-protein kinase 3-like [Vicia villosa]|uniref:CBL-interacting serine/threonine-protein kinase 3-like n=1 Tax=Vicia villosa TaxID=3911 RepID=UPI00273A8A14|nr:CBL-interacting serine/threonine-protein kinase 3-like [Vicia villosa]
MAENPDAEGLKKDYKPPVFEESAKTKFYDAEVLSEVSEPRRRILDTVYEESGETNLEDEEVVLKKEMLTTMNAFELKENKEEQPTSMNAFELISMSKGLNLENLFDIEQGFKRETRFTSTSSADVIINKIEEAAKPLGFDVQKKNFKIRLANSKAGRKGSLNVAIEVFQVAPSLHMVEVKKVKGDTLEFHKFYKKLSTSLEDVV